MLADQERIIELVRQKGLCLPSDIYKQVGTNLLFTSAMLGEMVSSGQLKVTYIKRGSSPYYYLEDQKEKLQDISNYLNEKDKPAYNLLKEKKILRDSEQTPQTRASLRLNLKDYAIPLNVNIDGQVHLFWKWYLLLPQEAERDIKIMLGIIKEEPKKEEIKKEEVKREEIKREEPKKIKERKAIEPKKHEVQKEITEKQIEQPIIQKPKIPQDITTNFLEQITKYFVDNKIIIHSKDVMNKQKTEFDFIIEMPSPVGNLNYYCKAKDKKKINDGDIASALLQGQQKRLPTLVLINGEMTKKTKDMLNNELKGVIVYKI